MSGVGRIAEAWSPVAREAALRARRLKQGQRVKVAIPRDTALAEFARSQGASLRRVGTVVDPKRDGKHPLVHLGSLGHHEIPAEWITHAEEEGAATSRARSRSAMKGARPEAIPDFRTALRNGVRAAKMA